MAAFYRFERAIAAGLFLGQTLRCARATVALAPGGTVGEGPWEIRYADGTTVTLDGPTQAARLWHLCLRAQVLSEN